MSSVDTLSVRMAILEKYGIEIVPPHDAVREMAKAMLTYKQKNKDFEKEYEELNIEYKNVLAKLIDGKRTQILEYSPLKMEKNQIPVYNIYIYIYSNFGKSCKKSQNGKQ